MKFLLLLALMVASAASISYEDHQGEVVLKRLTKAEVERFAMEDDLDRIRCSQPTMYHQRKCQRKCVGKLSTFNPKSNNMAIFPEQEELLHALQLRRPRPQGRDEMVQLQLLVSLQGR